MNILIDLRPLQSGKISGVEVFTKNVVEQLLQLGQNHHFWLWTNSAKPLSKNFPQFKNFNAKRIHTHIPNRLLNFNLALWRRPKLDKYLAQKCGIKGFDIMFLPDLRPAPVSKKCHKYIVVHDLSFVHFPQTFSWKSRLWHKLLRVPKEIKEARKIFTPSEFTKNDIHKTFKTSLNKIEVISEGVGAKFFMTKEKETFIIKKKYNLPDKFILSLSTLEPRKNLSNLIQGFHRFNLKNPQNDLYLVIAGEKDPQIFAKLKLPHEPKVVFTGFIAEFDKPALYSAALAFIFPSIFEGFGLPVLEAMACGAPILTSSFTALPEVAGRNGKEALHFNPLKTKDICDRINEIYFNEDLRQKLSRRSLQRSQKFSWSNPAQKILQTWNLK